MRPLCALFAAFAACLVLTPFRTGAAEPRQPPVDASIPTPGILLALDPQIVQGRLENGLAFMVMKRPGPPGSAQALLHVDVGSLDEADTQRGMAHFVSHMALAGSASFPSGSAPAFFESMGMVLVAHDFASTGIDQSVYRLNLPDAAPATFDRAFLFLSDVAGRLTFPDEQVEAQRQLILEEQRRGIVPEQRIGDLVQVRLTPGSRVAARPPLGVDHDVATFARADLLEFYSRRYVPSRMTVIVIADADPAGVIERIKAAFGGLAGAPSTPAPDAGVRPTAGVSAVVASDFTFRDASLTVTRVEPALPAVLTVGDWRRQLIERLAVQAFDRRLEGLIALGRLRAREVDVRVGQVGRAVRRIEAEFRAEVGAWRAMVADAVAQLREARLQPFTHDELATVRAGALERAQRSANTDATRPAIMLARLIDGAVGAGEPFMSAAQEFELGRRVLPTITDEEINAAARELFDPDNSVLVLLVPSGAMPITEADVLAAASGTASPAAEPARALLAELPADGTVRDSVRHVPSSVLSLWLSNNVRVHLRFMDNRLDTATISVALPGGELRETGATRGLSRAASEAFRTPASSRLSSADIRELLAGRNISISGSAGADALNLSIIAPPSEIESAFQLAHVLLSDPRVEPAALDSWKKRQLAAIDQVATDPFARFAALLPDVIYPPGEVRPRFLTSEQVNAVSLDAAQAWLSEAVRTAPIEVSIVGNVEEARAVKLAARYFGSLAARPRVSADLYRDLRVLPAPVAQGSRDVQVPGAASKAQALAGFFGPDASNIRDTRLLSLAARVLTARLNKELRDDRKVVSGVAASVVPGEAYPGYGLVYAGALCAPAEAAGVPALLNGVLDEFARSGPTEAEMKALHRTVNEEMAVTFREPAFWTEALRDLDFRGASLDDIVNEPTALLVFTGEEIREAFARYRAGTPHVQLVVRGASVSPAPDAAAK